jgi:hypothetical protein
MVKKWLLCIKVQNIIKSIDEFDTLIEAFEYSKESIIMVYKSTLENNKLTHPDNIPTITNDFEDTFENDKDVFYQIPEETTTLDLVLLTTYGTLTEYVIRNNNSNCERK